MYGNSLGDEGAANLASLFADGGALSGLTTLGIGVNSIGAAGAAALGKAIGSCPTCKLSTLGLYRNDVGDEGAMALAESVVAPNIDLQNLFLGGNGISDTGAVALASALMSNNNLIALSLEGGGIGDKGVEALATPLARSDSAIKSLDIRSCLPTHRSCSHSFLSAEDAADFDGKTTLSKRGIDALRHAIAARGGSGSLKVVGDVSFSS